MNITYLCPVCEQTVRSELTEEDETLACPACGDAREIPTEAIGQGRLEHCLVCPSTELFVRKDFPQRIGVGIVVLGFIASSIAWGYYKVVWAFAILFGVALIDVALFLFVGEALMCYRCHAQYRGFRDRGRHGQFNLETHERHRQIAARTPSGRPS
jgi:hypothetical protein